MPRRCGVRRPPFAERGRRILRALCRVVRGAIGGERTEGAEEIAELVLAAASLCCDLLDVWLEEVRSGGPGDAERAVAVLAKVGGALVNILTTSTSALQAMSGSPGTFGASAGPRVLTFAADARRLLEDRLLGPLRRSGLEAAGVPPEDLPVVPLEEFVASTAKGSLPAMKSAMYALAYEYRWNIAWPQPVRPARSAGVLPTGTIDCTPSTQLIAPSASRTLGPNRGSIRSGAQARLSETDGHAAPQ